MHSQEKIYADLKESENAGREDRDSQRDTQMAELSKSKNSEANLAEKEVKMKQDWEENSAARAQRAKRQRAAIRRKYGYSDLVQQLAKMTKAFLNAETADDKLAQNRVAAARTALDLAQQDLSRASADRDRLKASLHLYSVPFLAGIDMSDMRVPNHSFF